MKDIIINQPHLQNLRQKLGSRLLAIISWLLWLYFLAPLFTLGGWFMGIKSLSDEIRWFGGYKTLLQLLTIYGEIVLAIALAWLAWSFFLSWLHASIRPKPHNRVTDQGLSQRFGVDDNSLLEARAQQKIAVHFDDHANITALDCIKDQIESKRK